MPSTTVYNVAGEAVEELELSERVFGITPNVAVLHQVVTAQLVNRRQGTASTKTRAEVAGGSKKPYRQKGTGHARQGSIRSPHYRHGGVVHGPTPRSYEQSMPKKMRRAAIKAALSAKVQGEAVKVLETLTLPEISTKRLAGLLETVGVSGRTMLVVSTRDQTLQLSARNIPKLSLRVLPGLPTYEGIQADHLLFTR